MHDCQLFGASAAPGVGKSIAFNIVGWKCAMRKGMHFVLVLGIALLGLRVPTAKADNASGNIFFTTFLGGENDHLQL